MVDLPNANRVKRLAAASLVALALASPGRPGPAAAAPLGTVSAALNGRPIALAEIAQHACHDRFFPAIHCFDSLTSLQADEGQSLASPGGASPAGLAGAYVRWYRDSNFSGPSFDAYMNYSDLAAIGWNDVISSFTPLNGGHPVWWQGPSLTGVRWDWGTSSEGSLGSANDQFSSVQKW